jgi:hypothetical protein
VTPLILRAIGRNDALTTPSLFVPETRNKQADRALARMGLGAKPPVLLITTEATLWAMLQNRNG